MPYESRSDLVARLVKIDTALDKVRVAQSYDTALGTSTTRANYRALMEERKEVIEKIEALDASTAGKHNKVKFVRPS